MAEKSVHDKLSKVRKPRVHVTFDLETGEGKEKKELPFVVGVMGDFSGNNGSPKKSLKERAFVEVSRDNFDEVMEKIDPGVSVKVDNTLKDDGSQMMVDLKFSSMEDFEPAKIAQQVEPLRKLMEERDKLSQLLTKIDNSDELRDLLDKVLQNPEDLAALSKELGKNDHGHAIDTDKE